MQHIDAHQHFWKYSAAEYDWIDDRMVALQRDYLPADLKPLLQATGFDGSIAVQARQSLAETRWLLELAGQNHFILGVVGWVDLCSAQVRNELSSFAGNRRLVGVRHIVQAEPDDEFMLGKDFVKGIGLVREFGLAYDLLLYPRHLPVAAKLVRQFPEQRFVLDHIGKPFIADGLLKPWAGRIRELAKFPYVSCKLSGMVTEAKWKRWTQADFRPYLDVVLEAFGPERVMIGSDWPVCTVSADYTTTMGIVREYLKPLTAEQQDGILGANCARVYRIEPERP